MSCRAIQSGASHSLKYLLGWAHGELDGHRYIFFIRRDGAAHGMPLLHALQKGSPVSAIPLRAEKLLLEHAAHRAPYGPGTGDVSRFTAHLGGSQAAALANVTR